MKGAKTMARVRLIVGWGLSAGVLLCSCGESPDAPARHNRTLGDSKEGAPLAPAVFDPGVLQDAAAYQPTKPAGSLGSGIRTAGGRGDVTGGDADTQVRRVVENLINAIKDGEVELALKCFEADHVTALSEDQYDVLFATFSKVGGLLNLLSDKLDVSKAERLLGELRGSGAVEPKWDLLDADHASVRPNLALILFGPVKRAPSMAVGRQADGWRFQFDAPLTAADVEAILAFHAQLQDALDQIHDWVDASEKVDEAQLRTVLSQALAGEPIELGGPREEPAVAPDGGRTAPSPPDRGRTAPPPPGGGTGGG